MIKRFVGRLQRSINRNRVLSSGASIGVGAVFHSRPIISISPGSTITIGAHVVLTSDSQKTALGVSRPCILRTLSSGSKIKIGDHSGLSGTTICSTKSVTIGDRVLIGADVMIADTDFHPMELPRRYAPVPPAAEVDRILIEDDVFIGARSIVLKGSTVGRGSIIGAGSVVTGNIPPYTVAAGVPARVIRRLTREESGIE